MGNREGEVTRVLKRVAQTLDRGKFDEALRELLHLSEKYPDAGEIRPQIAEVFLRRGESRALKGKLKEARADWERSLTWAQKPAAYVALALAMLAEGKLDRADELLNAVLEIDDRYGPAHEALGRLFLRWQDYGEATRAFEQALGCGHATPELYRAVWETYMRVDRPDRAHELVMEGVDRFPESDLLQAAAGDSYVYAKGESAQAVPYWRRAAEINPSNFGAQFGLAAQAASRGDRAEALDRLQRSVALDLDRARRLWREDIASPLGKFADFARDQEFRKALGWQPD